MIRRYRIDVVPEHADGHNISVHINLTPASDVIVTGISVQPGTSDAPFPSLELSRLDFGAVMNIVQAVLIGEHPRIPLIDKDESMPVPSKPTESRRPPAATNKRIAAAERPTESRTRSSTGAPPDLARVYWRLASVPKVAKHYDVPRQVARDWVNELQRRQAIPKAWHTKPAD